MGGWGCTTCIHDAFEASCHHEVFHSDAVPPNSIPDPAHQCFTPSPTPPLCHCISVTGPHAYKATPLGSGVTPPSHMQPPDLTHLAVCREDELAMPVAHMLLHGPQQVLHASVLHSLWSSAHHLRLIKLDALQQCGSSALLTCWLSVIT